MKYIKILESEFKKDILKFLYENEVMNVMPIHLIENEIEHIDGVYYKKANGKLLCVMVCKDDGNSYFTTFYAPTIPGILDVSLCLKNITHPRLMIAGTQKDVGDIMNHLNLNDKIYSDLYMVWKLQPLICNPNFEYKEAVTEDLTIIQEMMVDFFEADTEADQTRIKEKINLQNIRLLRLDGEIIGMGKLYGHSQNYMDLTGIFLRTPYRNKGYGKVLMAYLIKEVIMANKIPILQTSKANDAAKKLYENIGFQVISDYAFQFINKKS